MPEHRPRVHVCTHIVIWLDQHIGKVDQCTDLKQIFSRIASPEIISGIDDPDIMHASSWRNFSDVMGPIIYVDTIDGCLQHLSNYALDKRIFLITSGFLGRSLLPIVKRLYPAIESVYVFCFNIMPNREWAIEFEDRLQMFDHEMHLLCRLTRDISRYYINLGRNYESESNCTSALACFQFAHTLRLRADLMDHDSSTKGYSNDRTRELNAFIQNLQAQLANS